MSEVTVERLKKNIDLTIDKVFEGDFSVFMRIMANLPDFDYRNQLLIWRQKSDATCVAGAKAFDDSQRKLNQNAQPIYLLYPKVDLVNLDDLKKAAETPEESKEKAVPRYELKYMPVRAYDISDTKEGDNAPQKRDHKDIFEALKKNDIDVVATNDKSSRKPGRKTFEVDTSLNDDGKCKSLIRQFITHVTDEGIKNDKSKNRAFTGSDEENIRELIIACVMHYYGICSISDDPGTVIRYKNFQSFSHDDKRRVIERISRDVSDVVRMLDGVFITFSEMSLVNTFCTFEFMTVKRDRFIEEFLRPTLGAITKNDPDIREDADRFIEYLSICNLKTLTQLMAAARGHRAFTYPKMYYDI